MQQEQGRSVALLSHSDRQVPDGLGFDLDIVRLERVKGGR